MCCQGDYAVLRTAGTNSFSKNEMAFCRFSSASLPRPFPRPQSCPAMAIVYASGVLLYSSLARYRIVSGLCICEEKK